MNYHEWEYKQKELMESLEKKWCICIECDYRSTSKKEMLQHIVDEHGFRLDVNKTNVYVTEFDYIVLRKLVDLAVKQENKYKQYITISNSDIHKGFGCGVSNQKPRKVLDELNLLTRYRNQKQSCLGFDKHSRRVYYIHRQRIEEAVSETPYDDLKVKLALIDENEIRIKPLKPLGSQDQNGDESTKETKELENEDGEWEI